MRWLWTRTPCLNDIFGPENPHLPAFGSRSGICTGCTEDCPPRQIHGKKVVDWVTKDCLLSSQEQACSRITWLFSRLVVWLPTPCQNGLIHKKMVVDCVVD